MSLFPGLQQNSWVEIRLNMVLQLGFQGFFDRRTGPECGARNSTGSCSFFRSSWLCQALIFEPCGRRFRSPKSWNCDGEPPRPSLKGNVNREEEPVVFAHNYCAGPENKGNQIRLEKF